MKINMISLVKLYDMINTAITTPIYIARFRPGSLFSPVLNDVTLTDMLVFRWNISIEETFEISRRTALTSFFKMSTPLRWVFKHSISISLPVNRIINIDAVLHFLRCINCKKHFHDTTNWNGIPKWYHFRFLTGWECHQAVISLKSFLNSGLHSNNHMDENWQFQNQGLRSLR